MKKTVWYIIVVAVVWACDSGGPSGAAGKNEDSLHSGHNAGQHKDSTAVHQNHTAAMHQAMNEMMTQMNAVQPTGDADHDFARLMKLHHQSAVSMARAELAGGSDTAMKKLARQIIADQEREITAMDRFLQSHQPSGTSDYGQRAVKMMTEMSMVGMESGSLDAVFASMMIPHHQDGVKMAQEYRKLGKNKELLSLADNIIATQPKEVEQLRQWLAANKN